MFTMSEIEELCGIPFQTLHNWVRDGIVKPMKRGGKGVGNATQFSKQQAVGFALVGAMRDSRRGCEANMVRYLLAEMPKLKWEALAESLEKRTAPARVQTQTQPEGQRETTWQELFEKFVDPDETLDMGRRLVKVYEEAKKRIAIEAIRSGKAS
jgi:hypothetical protein